MKTKVSFVMRLSGTKNTIDLLPPCTYCGKSVEGQDDPIWKVRKVYNLREWRRNRKGHRILGNKMDAQGKPMQGVVDVRVPYCSEHIKSSLGNLYGCLDIGMFLGAILFTILLIRSSKYDVVNLITCSVVTFFGSLFVLFLLNRGIRFIVTQFPKYKDYPMEEGNWGLEISTKTDDGQKGIVSVKYLLYLDFVNVESAKRFYDANEDRVQVVQGKEYVIS